MKDYFNFIGQSDLPKCPLENLEFQSSQYGNLAFVGEILGDLVVIQAIPISAWMWQYFSARAIREQTTEKTHLLLAGVWQDVLVAILRTVDSVNDWV